MPSSSPGAIIARARRILLILKMELSLDDHKFPDRGTHRPKGPESLSDCVRGPALIRIVHILNNCGYGRKSVCGYGRKRVILHLADKFWVLDRA